MAVQRIGNTGKRESWDSGKRRMAEIESLELVFRGNFEELSQSQPARGTVGTGDNGIPAGYVVESSDLTPQKGELGEMRVFCREVDASVTQKPSGAITATIEIDMAQLEKPLLSKPGISDALPLEIEMWKNSPIELRRAMKFEQSGGTYDLSADAQRYAKLILKGVESYLVFSPVVSRTSTYKTRPNPENCSKIETPPISIPGDWEYLKTADRIVQQTDGKYVRTEQWTGADEWERELYEEA